MDEELSIESGVESIASDLGLGSGEQETETTESQEGESVETSAAEQSEVSTEEQTEETQQEQTQVQVRSAPKAWAKEKHEIWAKLPPEAQEYIEHREKQVLDGLGQYSEKAKRADVWESAVKDYMPLIQAQGAQPQEAVRYLFEAHKQLSSGSPEQRAAYLAKVAQSYGIDFAKAAASAGAQAEEPAAVRELRERTERLERERQEERDRAASETRAKVASEVTTFAEAKDEKGNAKHPYFDECATHIVALINAGHALEEAYEMAVWANPVTREKEKARLRTENEAALRAKAKKEAEAARQGSRTNVNSKDTRRAPTASKSGNWEDTLVSTLQDIKQRQTH